MPYAANDRVSNSPIDGGIPIDYAQYREALDGMAQGKVVRIDNGFEVKDKPHPTTYWLSADDRRQTEPGEDVPAEGTTTPPPDRFHDLADGVWEVNLDRLESALLVQIDAKASEVRGRFITAGTGQSAAYMRKLEEARAYKNANSPNDSDYPRLKEEADRRGMTVGDLSAEVIQRNNEWSVPEAQIEAERVGGKGDVRKATTADNKRTAADNAIATLDGITP